MSQLRPKMFNTMKCGLTYRKLLYVRKHFQDIDLYISTNETKSQVKHYIRPYSCCSDAHLKQNADFLSLGKSNFSLLNYKTYCTANKRDIFERCDEGRSDKIKLHKRVLSEEDLERDRQMSENIENLAVEDSFGNLQVNNTEQLSDSKVGYYNTSSRKRFNKVSHKRELSENDLEEDRVLLEPFSSISKEDTFGTFNKSNTLKPTGQIDGSGLDKAEQRSKFVHPGSGIWQELKKSQNKKSSFKRQNDKDFNSSQHDKRWRNTFGTLSDVPHVDEELEGFSDEEEDVELKPHFRLVKTGRRHNPDWYGKKILKLGKKGKVREAIEVFEVWMLQEDRVKPNNFVLTALLITLGRAGYTKKAFQVFNMYKKLGLQPNEYVFSCLFNACANSPWPEDGLQRATHLLEDLAIKDFKPNAEMYNSMIKAFAFCGDSRTAYLLADKLQNEMKLTPVTYSHVLMAAISDKKAGFWYAVQVWRWMLIKRVQPDLKLYNLMLRVIKECNVGDQNLVKQLLTPVNPASTLRFFKKTTTDVEQQDEMSLKKIKGSRNSSVHMENVVRNDKCISDGVNNSLVAEQIVDVGVENDIAISSQDSSLKTNSHVRLPNVLNINENFSDILAVSTITTPQDRFAMVGGMKGFFKDMEKYGVKPDIQTFDQMLSVVHPEEELELLTIMDTMGVQADSDFYANLMLKKCKRYDYTGAKDVLGIINRKKLVCNMRVYSALALTCTSFKDGMELITTIRNLDLSPNIVVYGALVNASKYNFNYKMVLLKMMAADGLKPNQKILQTIESQLIKARNLILYKEKNQSADESLKRLDSSFEEFKMFYQSWLRNMDLEVPDHPWSSFRSTTKEKAEQKK